MKTRPDLAGGASNGDGPFGCDLDLEAWYERVRRAGAAGTSEGEYGRLGEYELLGIAGRGGQGVVYKARQPRTGRTVALKRLAAGAFSTPEMQSRFEREIEVAAALEHPSVVTVFGSERIGDQVVLAMQWVDGIPFDTWAAGAAAEARQESPPEMRPVREVLESFAQVCDAVHHAHQRGVLHRDLKPSNILVDSGNRPHVLDFGLAKLRAADDDDSSLTRTGGLIGTPVFASPEVVRGEVRAIDTRSDIYALGVVLYASLSGRLPHPPRDDLAQLLQEIQQREPALPSSLNRRLDHELDAIIFKSIAKEKTRRYDSVAALAADVRRYLAGQAVLAHPPTGLYHARKFIRRHWLVVLISAVILGLLLSATAIATASYLRAEEALEKQKQLSETATAQWNRSRVTGEFLRELFESSENSTPARDALTVRDLLDRASAKLERESGQKDASAEATLRMIIGNAYYKLGLAEKAMAHYARALALRRQGGVESIEVAEAMDALGKAYRVQNRLADAEPLVEGAHRLRHKLLAPDDGYLALSANSLGLLKRALGKYDDAELLFREAIERYTAQFGPDDESIPVNMLNLALVYEARGERERAEAQYRDALAFGVRIHGATHEDVAKCKYRFGNFLGQDKLRLDEAASLLRESADTLEALYGREHPLARAVRDDLAKLRARRAEESQPVEPQP